VILLRRDGRKKSPPQTPENFFFPPLFRCTSRSAKMADRLFSFIHLAFWRPFSPFFLSLKDFRLLLLVNYGQLTSYPLKTILMGWGFSPPSSPSCLLALAFRGVLMVAGSVAPKKAHFPPSSSRHLRYSPTSHCQRAPFPSKRANWEHPSSFSPPFSHPYFPPSKTVLFDFFFPPRNLNPSTPVPRSPPLFFLPPPFFS